MDGFRTDQDLPFDEAVLQAQPESQEFVDEAEAPEFSPFGALARIMRKRWLVLLGLVVVLGGGLGYLGFVNGSKTYSTQAILRVSAHEPGILFASGDDSKLKLFQSFVKAETTYVASSPVMERATAIIKSKMPDADDELTAKSLAESIEIKRKEALIILKTNSKDPEFAALKLNSVIQAFMDLKVETKEKLENFRANELTVREAELLAQLQDLNAQTLEAGGEFGMASLVKTHIEKVTQIESLIARQAEVKATLLAISSSADSAGSADMADQEIMRATLLDRALADLNFDKAKREAELTSLLKRYAENTPKVIEKKEEIAIISSAMADRRDQIKVLGQTGALTEGGEANQDDQMAEISALLEKVTSRLETAREEARELNRKRIELTFLEEEREELRRKLDETRHALDVIQLESRNSMPGLVDVMAFALVPQKPAEDSAKMLGAGGFVGGAVLAIILVMGYGLTYKKVRYTDDLWRHTWFMPILTTIKATATPAEIETSIHRLRNNIKLFPSRTRPDTRKARIIAVNRFDSAESGTLARKLADSFATANLRTLYIDADLQTVAPQNKAGWRDLIVGEYVQPECNEFGAEVIGAGSDARITDATVSLVALRKALSFYEKDYAVIVVNSGNLDTGLSSELFSSTADLAVSVVNVDDMRSKVNAGIDRIMSLARNGSALVFTGATGSDPAVTA
ncbi:hypothetical protein Q4578_14405 [Shimia thalassica]|uniref:hypothetical protein n=1 Tax=Shimia thalassica TaxID=1715693 RepID=UPI0026E423F3|nr:hypothetical protein [Shimia thalassica]MDO6522787.1 hypothetical protein [Shimia thalassica]